MAAIAVSAQANLDRRDAKLHEYGFFMRLLRLAVQPIGEQHVDRIICQASLALAPSQQLPDI
jgi:hypothetical protein